MQIADDMIVQFFYTVKDENGQTLESNFGDHPVSYLHGHKRMMVGVEKALTGREVGDAFSVTLPPEETYGKRIENSEHRVPVKHLLGAKNWKPGMMAVIHTEQGQRQVTILKAGKFMATVDANHPMAGKTLTFDIQVVDVHEATAAEKSQ